MFGNVHRKFFVFTLPVGGKGGVAGIWWVEAKDAVQYLKMNVQTNPTVENYLAPNVYYTKLEKFYFI